MSADERRKAILKILESSDKPISATFLAKELGVSRQVIVGDVALLRALEHKIIATSRGYILESSLVSSGYTGKLACFHKPEDTQKELYAIVDNGGTILDVVITHEIYGELTGRLNLSSRAEVDGFLKSCENTSSKLLTELTGGIHLHTVTCKDKATFAKIHAELNKIGIIYNEE